MSPRRAVWPALLVLLLAIGVWASGGAGRDAAAQATYPYQDASLSPEERADDLLPRMSLEEKVGQMTQINATALQGVQGDPWDRGPLNEVILDDVLVREPHGVDPVGRRGLAAGEHAACLGTDDERHPGVRPGLPAARHSDHLRDRRGARAQQRAGRDDVPAPVRARCGVRHRAGPRARTGDRNGRARDRHPLGFRPGGRHLARPALGPLLRAVQRGAARRGRPRGRSGARPRGRRPDRAGRLDDEALHRLLGAGQRP